MAGTILGNSNIWHLSTHTLLCLLVPLENCRGLSNLLETPILRLLISDLLLLFLFELLCQIALTLLLLVAELRHGFGVLHNGWFSGWHNNI